MNEANAYPGGEKVERRVVRRRLVTFGSFFALIIVTVALEDLTGRQDISGFFPNARLISTVEDPKFEDYELRHVIRTYAIAMPVADIRKAIKVKLSSAGWKDREGLGDNLVAGRTNAYGKRVNLRVLGGPPPLVVLDEYIPRYPYSRLLARLARIGKR